MWRTCLSWPQSFSEEWICRLLSFTQGLWQEYFGVKFLCVGALSIPPLSASLHVICNFYNDFQISDENAKYYQSLLTSYSVLAGYLFNYHTFCPWIRSLCGCKALQTAGLCSPCWPTQPLISAVLERSLHVVIEKEGSCST